MKTFLKNLVAIPVGFVCLVLCIYFMMFVDDVVDDV